jgi:hypothetical protein
LWCCAARTGALAASLALVFAVPVKQAHADGQSSQPASLNDYIDRLEKLDSLVADCQKERNANSCDPLKVGADIQVQWTEGGVTMEREVRFGWLRLLLDRGKEKDKPAAPANGGVQTESGASAETPPPLPPVDTLLTQARDRLGNDEKQAAAIAGAAPPSLNRDVERKSLNAILAQKEYKKADRISWKDRLLEELENRLNDLLARLADNSAHVPWAALAFRIFWIGALCLALAWFLIRMERRSRVRLSADPVPSPGAPSAREWQLWLEDAQQMAAEGRWREAIHYVYWASISRLESRRLWPADRARTPREYLLLLPREDLRKASLTALTRSFERTWYGGREAISSEYQAALKLAAELGVE